MEYTYINFNQNPPQMVTGEDGTAITGCSDGCYELFTYERAPGNPEGSVTLDASIDGASAMGKEWIYSPHTMSDIDIWCRAYDTTTGAISIYFDCDLDACGAEASVCREYNPAPTEKRRRGRKLTTKHDGKKQ